MRITKENLIQYREVILDLQRRGYSECLIGKVLGKHPSTICHHLQEMNIKMHYPTITQRSIKKDPISLEQALLNPTKLPNLEVNFLSEKINPGKMSYADYLKADQERHFKELLRGKTPKQV